MNPAFSPLIWTVTYLGFPQSVWPVALAIETERKTLERNREGAVMAFMENADPDPEYVWRGILKLMKDLGADVELIFRGLDHLEQVSRAFLKCCTRKSLAAMPMSEAVDTERQADETRLLVRFFLPELRERLQVTGLNLPA